ncbi:MAG: SEC-C metal-binding domain-containing protein [candidate division KSB1 bacterium]|nr:SEC-C metal-binding domain-containing protein [candidate division KSB1 bacterium]MDZ7301546.1 SEC-C metal-binding domain-containing protein [candidate division KSB1 bacterium]MDZ7311038.1 SEC-C metal-binding domain-containing protein [candidate division KSB1 bacterium]
MNLESLRTELTEYCQTHLLTKFSPEEIIELLQDGESVEWLTSMLVPAEQQSQHGRLAELLTSIRQEVYKEPPPAPSSEEIVETAPELAAGETPEEPVIDEAELEKMALSMLPPGVDARQFMSSPQGALMADFAVFCQEKGVDIQNLDGGKVTDEIRALQEEWMQTSRETLQGKTPGEVLGGRPLIPQKVETVRRQEPKVGRNDPCPCGSGKKYKKCHGAEA